MTMLCSMQTCIFYAYRYILFNVERARMINSCNLYIKLPLGSSLALSSNPVDWLWSVVSSSASMSKSWGWTSKSAGGLANGWSWSLWNDCEFVWYGRGVSWIIGQMIGVSPLNHWAGNIFSRWVHTNTKFLFMGMVLIFHHPTHPHNVSLCQQYG